MKGEFYGGRIKAQGWKMGKFFYSIEKSEKGVKNGGIGGRSFWVQLFSIFFYKFFDQFLRWFIYLGFRQFFTWWIWEGNLPCKNFTVFYGYIYDPGLNLLILIENERWPILTSSFRTHIPFFFLIGIWDNWKCLIGNSADSS